MWLVWNGLKASEVDCEGGADWVGGVGAGAVLIGWGGSTTSGIWAGGCILGGPEEGKKEKLDSGL